MNPRTCLAALALLATLFGAACSPRDDINDPPPTRDATETGATPGTTPPESPEPPEDDLPPELREVLDDVAELRGLEAPPSLDAEIISRDEVVDVFHDLLTEEDFEDAARIESLYHLIGYMENDLGYIELYESFLSDAVLGFYVPDLDRIWIVTDGDANIDFSQLSRNEITTLAHELQHAIQDHNFDLDQVTDSVPNDPDHNLTYTAIVEGDASNTEEEYTRAYLRGGSVLVALGRTPAQIGIPAPILREEFFPYIQGPEFVRDVIDEFGIERLDELLQSPPTATSYILHPDRLESGWEPEDVALPALGPILGDDFDLVWEGTFGEFEWSNYLQQGATGSVASGASNGWIGDHFAVYASGSESLAAFRVRFEDEDERDEFDVAHNLYMSGFDQLFAEDYRVAELDDGDAVAAAPVGATEMLIVHASSPGLAASTLEALLNA